MIAPATSLAYISAEVRAIALANLERMNLRVSFSRNAEESDLFSSSSIASRVEDVHAAFLDPHVKGILTSIGGYNSNQLLSYLDYDLIAANPKILCGYSDITALSSAILARTGLVTYCGPHFSTFGMKRGLEYTMEFFTKCLFEEGPYKLTPSGEWSDDAWYADQEKRRFEPNAGYVVVNQGFCQGRIVGGNLCTLNLLQGSEYMPPLARSILFIEDDYESQVQTFDRDLQSLIHQPGFGAVRGIVIGRFQRESHMSQEKLEHILRTKRELHEIPVVIDADFGHTTPQFTFPIGGRGELRAEADRVDITVLEH